MPLVIVPAILIHMSLLIPMAEHAAVLMSAQPVTGVWRVNVRRRCLLRRPRRPRREHQRSVRPVPDLNVVLVILLAAEGTQKLVIVWEAMRVLAQHAIIRLGASCRNRGRSWCDNYQGYGKTCCEVGYTCCGSTDGCCSGGGPITTNTTTPHNTSTPGDNTPIPTSPPGVTSTPTPIPQQCQAIKLYKDGVLVTDYSTVHAGDTVVVAVAAGTAAKARVRINGAAWQETTTKNANNEFVVTLTVPTGVTSVTVEAEIFADGVWK